MPIVFLGLGSNLNNPEAQLNHAVDSLKAHPHIQQLRQSQWYASTPMDCPEGSPDFLNGVLELHTTLSLNALHDFCQWLETQAGRLPEKDRLHHAPRPLDVDILFYGDLILHTPELIIPHPRLHERLFVLEPMLELAPSWEHPIFKQSIQLLFKAV
jgi:2-amino-4-hydroxy-6-hydroxymethyldihydropteridine diphosphokinase